MKYDPVKMADLVAEESKLKEELQEAKVKLNDLNATDDWDEKKGVEYQRITMDHMRMDASVRTVSEERRAYELREPEAAKQAQNMPLARWLREGEEGLEASERQKFITVKRDNALPDGGGPVFRITDFNYGGIKAATASDATSGQEAVQERIRQSVLDRLAYFGGVDKMAQRFITDTGGDWPVPQMDATAQKGLIIGSQDTSVGALDLPDIGVQTFGAKTGSSRKIVITREMIQDAVFDIQTYAERQAVRRLGRAWNAAFTKTLTGLTNPVGVLTIAKDGLTTATNNAIIWKETAQLPYKINKAYRERSEMGEGGFTAEMGGRTGYMISDDMEMHLFLLSDGDSRPLWVPSTREGVPDMLNKWPYEVNDDLDDVEPSTAGVGNEKVPMLFGNFSYYGIRTIAEIELFRFMDSKTMEKNTMEVLALSRRDGRALGPIVNDRVDAIARLTMKI